MNLSDVKKYLDQKAKRYYEEHQQAFETWRYGSIDKVWIDNHGFLCIQYETGDWFHYDENGDWW